MISIRTALVVSAFVAMGLTSAAEYLARAKLSEPTPFVTVGVEEASPGKLLLTRKASRMHTDHTQLPWI